MGVEQFLNRQILELRDQRAALSEKVARLEAALREIRDWGRSCPCCKPTAEIARAALTSQHGVQKDDD